MLYDNRSQLKGVLAPGLFLFNEHEKLEGTHAPFGASNYHWINYTPDKLVKVVKNMSAARRGTELHDLAHRLIKHGIRLPDERKTLNLYVNSSIHYGLKSEQVLYYSDNFFGTADAIGLDDVILRISDLKTGVTPASIHQLEIYAAFWCLEYDVNPFDITFELRIFQNDDVQVFLGDPAAVNKIMTTIVEFDRIITLTKAEEGL